MWRHPQPHTGRHAHQSCPWFKKLYKVLTALRAINQQTHICHNGVRSRVLIVRSRSILMQVTAKKSVWRGEKVTKLLGVPKRSRWHMIRSPRFQQDETALSSIAVVTKAIKRTARRSTSLSHLGTATMLFPAIWTKTARSIEELFSQWKRPRRASSDQRTDEEDTSETCNNNHAGGGALTNA